MATGFKSAGKSVDGPQKSKVTVQTSTTTTQSTGSTSTQSTASSGNKMGSTTQTNPKAGLSGQKATASSQAPQPTAPSTTVNPHDTRPIDSVDAPLVDKHSGTEDAGAARARKEAAVQNDNSLSNRDKRKQMRDLKNEYGTRGKETSDRGPSGAEPPRAAANLLNRDAHITKDEAANHLASQLSSRKGDQKYLAGVMKFAGKNRKKLAGGGGVAGIIVLLMMSFFALLPLKLESIMKNILAHEAGRMESYVEHRAQRILFRYIFLKVTGTLASDGFYTGSTLIGTLYGNLAINKFENELFKNKGIKLEKCGSRCLRLTMPDGGSFDSNSEADFIRHMDTNLTGRAARDAIRDLVNDRYHPLRFLKRRHMRKYLRNAFNINRWGIRRQEDTRDPNDPDAPSSTEEALRENTLGPPEDQTIRSVDCIFGDNCDNPNERTNPDGTSRARPPSTPEQEHSGDVQSDVANGRTSIKDGIKQGYDTAKKAATKAITTGLQKIFGEIITKLLFKAIPVLGWIALAADIDAFLWSGNITFVSIALHSAQYVALAATWASIADQFKAGQLTGSQINVIMQMLNDIEKSNGVQRAVFGNHDAGTKLPDDKRVGSDKAEANADDSAWCGWNYFFLHPTVVNTTGFDLSDPNFWTNGYRYVMSAPPQFLHPILCTIRWPLDKIADGLSWLLGDLLSDIMGAAIDAINAIASAAAGREVDVMDAAQEVLQWVINHIWTPVVTGTEVGIELGNALDAGWDVISNRMCRDVLGCKNIPYAVAYQEQLALAEQHRAELRDLSPLAALVNTDYPESFGSQMLARIPSTPGAALGNISSTGLAMITNPFRYFGAAFSSVFFRPAHGAPAVAVEPNGVQKTGYDDKATLDNPELYVATKDIAGPPGDDGELSDPDGRIDQYDCPEEKDVNKTNPCLLDTAAAQVLCAGTSNNDDGGMGGNGNPGPCGDIVETTEQAGSTDGGGAPISGGWFDPSAGMACPKVAGITDGGDADGYHGGKLIRVHLCKVQGITVNVRLAESVNHLINESKKPKPAGLGNALTGGAFRTMEEQKRLRISNGCPDVDKSPSSSCRVPTARAGYSNHQMGLAIDFSGISQHDQGNPKFIWLKAHAAADNLKNFPKESWHWSVDGN